MAEEVLPFETQRSMEKMKKGLTLIELITVVCIISILGCGIVSVLFNRAGHHSWPIPVIGTR